MGEHDVNKDPTDILRLVEGNKEKEVWFDCAISINNKKYPITVAVHVLPHVWWIYIDYSQTSKYIDHDVLLDSSIEHVKCPIKEQQKEMAEQAKLKRESDCEE